MFCVECGKEPDTLHESLCKECYGKKMQAEIVEHIDIDVCTSCWAVKQGHTWNENPDMYTVMLDRIDRSIKISPQVDRYSFDVEFVEEDPRNFMANIDIKLISGEVEVKRELHCRIILKKDQCQTCSRIHGNYYEAILQVRPSKREMSDEQKDLVRAIVNREIEGRRGGERSIFITSSREIHGGLDFFMSDSGVTKKLSREISNLFGGCITSSSSLAGRKDGQNIYKVTYSVRIPPYEKGDFLRVDDEIYRVVETGTSSGHVTLFNLSSGKKISLDKRKLEEVEVLGGEELIRDAVLVSETEREMNIMDPDTYKTITLVKAGDHLREEGNIKVIKVEDRLLLLPREED